MLKSIHNKLDLEDFNENDQKRECIERKMHKKQMTLFEIS